MFEESVDDVYNKVLMIAIQSSDNHCDQMDVAVLDFARLRENLLKDFYNLQICQLWRKASNKSTLPLTPPNAAFGSI